MEGLTMKLWRLQSSETDWVAADTADQAVDVYKREYGLSDRDMDGVTVEEWNAHAVEVYPVDWDYDGDDDPPSAAEIMATMTRPGLVASTNN